MPKTIIFSDTHLTHNFDLKKFNYLKNLLKNYEQIIINGDFWSYYSCTLEQFLNSEWQKLFPYLKEKTIYIYGNHDRQDWCDERVKQFSKEQHRNYLLEHNNKKLHITHGHSLFHDSIDNEIFIKLIRNFKIDKFTYGSQKMMIKMYGVTRYNLLGKRFEDKYIQYANNLPKDEVLVVGHLHSPNLNLKERYINTGYINHGISYFVSLDESNIELVQESY